MLIDSHAHLDLPDFNGDREPVLARAREKGVGVIINVGVDLESSRRSLELTSNPGVYTAIGFHPNDVGKMKAGDLGLLAGLAQRDRVVAVGEIGLDFYRRWSPHQRQLEVLAQQLDLAVELGLPVVIHCREAHREMLGVLGRWVKSHALGGELGVMHCFSGDTRLARQYIELGFLISLAGPVTYPSAADRVEVAGSVPLEKLLSETDSPFLAPQRYRGQRNEPAHVSEVVERIARIRGLPVAAVARATAENAVRLFRLSGVDVGA